MTFMVGLMIGAVSGLLLFLYSRKQKTGQGVLRPSMTAGLEGLNAFPEPIALTEGETIVFHNAAFGRELGAFSQQGNWSGWLACVAPEEHITHDDSPTVHVTRGSARTDVQFRTTDHRLLHWTAVPFPGLGRKLVLNIVRDVTAWASPQYDQAAFMNRAAHELKTPITSIKGYAELLELYARTGKQITPEIAGRIVEQSNRLVHLINQFLDVARLGTGRLTDNPEPVALAGLLPRIIDRIREQFPGRTIDMQLEALPETLLDPTRFEQVVREVVFNALQYSPREKPVHISARPRHDSLQIQVRDQGIGIPSQDQAHVYERFSRGSNVTRMPGAGGYGLGLYLAREIVNRWHGEIRIDSAEKSGTVATVTLPLRRVPHTHERAADDDAVTRGGPARTDLSQ